MARKGALGRFIGVQPQCYAATLDGTCGCSLQVTEEHPLSQSLRRGSRMTLVESLKNSETGGWRETRRSRHHIKQASAPMLCTRHRIVGQDADAEALKLQRALVRSKERSIGQVLYVETADINGLLFGAWLCKYIVGMATMFGVLYPLDVLRYAFGRPTGRRVRFFLALKRDGSINPGHRFISLRVFDSAVEAGPEAFGVTFEGLRWIVTLWDRDNPQLAEVQTEHGPGWEWLDRPRVVQDGDTGHRIVFDWSDDPDASSLVTPSGSLILLR